MEYNKHHMVKFVRRGPCQCEEPMGLHVCPVTMDAEIHYIEELVTVLIENPCLKLIGAATLPK